MKRLTFVMALAFTLFAVSAMAGEMTGAISDAKCGAAHADGSEKSIKCVQGCVKGGQKPVFVTSDGKVLQIANPDKVMDHLGHKVTVTGNVDGETVTIDSVKHISS
ncbi:MAG: hypothetical protein KIT09_06450 [Bryobacteraceae bacterium]|nr:hypothetical protein [Bryobacteraceae bacterium]